MPAQNVTLTPDLEDFVGQEVENGHFKDASEVHRAGLETLVALNREQESKIEDLIAALQVGTDQADAGLCHDITEPGSLEKLLDEVSQRRTATANSDWEDAEIAA